VETAIYFIDYQTLIKIIEFSTRCAKVREKAFRKLTSVRFIPSLVAQE
jgi:hypothetical protein